MCFYSALSIKDKHDSTLPTVKFYVAIQLLFFYLCIMKKYNVKNTFTSKIFLLIGSNWDQENWLINGG